VVATALASSLVGFGTSVTYWLLENQQLPPGIVPPKPSLEPWLAPLREKYPTTPLDDDT
jgi:hypothetical protein